MKTETIIAPILAATLNLNFVFVAAQGLSSGIMPGPYYKTHIASIENAATKIQEGMEAYESLIKNGAAPGGSVKNMKADIVRQEADIARAVSTALRTAKANNLMSDFGYMKLRDPYVKMVIEYFLKHENTTMPLAKSGAVAKLAAKMRAVISLDLAKLILESPRSIEEILGKDFSFAKCDRGMMRVYKIRDANKSSPYVNALQINEPFYAENSLGIKELYDAGDVLIEDKLGNYKVVARQEFNKTYAQSDGHTPELAKPSFPKNYGNKINELTSLADKEIAGARENAKIGEVLGDMPRQRLFALLKTYFGKIRIAKEAGDAVKRHNLKRELDLTKEKIREKIHAPNKAEMARTIDAMLANPDVGTYFKNTLKYFRGYFINAVGVGVFIMTEEILNATNTSALTKKAQGGLRELLAAQRVAKAVLIEEARQNPELAALFNEEDIRDILNRKEPPVKPEDIYWAKYNLLASIYGIQKEGTLDNYLYKENLKELQEAKQEEYKGRIKDVIKQDATRVENSFIAPQLAF
jgi:hypothetical protein